MLRLLSSAQHRSRPVRALTTTVAAFGAAFSLAISGTATAMPADEVPPIGADAGRFKLPISCAISLPELGGLKVFDLPTEVDVQGVAPTQLGPGQQFYLTQGSGSITFPSELTSLGGLVGVNRADATVTKMAIGAAGADPNEINIAEDPIDINNIPIEPGKEVTVGLPQEGAFDVGPYTAPDSGAVTLQFNGATALVDLKTSWGFTLKVRADCTPTDRNALLSIGVGGPAGQPTWREHGVPLDFPPVEVDSQYGIINSPYDCTVLGRPFEVGIAVGANTPLSVERGGSIEFTNASGALVIPASTVNDLIDSGISTVSGTVAELTIRAEGGTPERTNVIPDNGITIPEQELRRGEQLIVPLPQDGTLNAGPWQPSTGSSGVRISLGSAEAELSFDGESSTTAACDAPSPPVYLLDAPVT